MSQASQINEKSTKPAAPGSAPPHANEMNEPIPHVGQALDGRHYLDVLEEQAHADQKPDLDGENPRHPDPESTQQSADK